MPLEAAPEDGSGYLERPKGGTLVFSIIVNSHAARYREILAEIDAVVLEMAK